MSEPTIRARLERALADRHRAPSTLRVLFEIAGRAVGSVLPEDAELLLRKVPGLTLEDEVLTLQPHCAGDTFAGLAAMALALREAGRAARWRDERLPVMADDGSLLGAVERGCVRALGVRTLSVHLVGETRGGSDAATGCWLQRRSMHKDTDPGMLDNLASGLVGMAEDGRSVEPLAQAMRREAAEEAGLGADALGALTPLGRWRLQAPVREGLMIEDVIVYRALLADDARPHNLDGEVTEFVHLGEAGILERIDAAELTRGATLAQLAWMSWRRDVPPRGD
ncbi:MAG: NUDIX domain-containing protein [Burkholderiaceae bacterium]